MNINLKVVNKYTAKVYADGILVGKAQDCDWCWVVACKDESHALDGSYPARSVHELAYAIVECVDGVDNVSVNSIAV